MSSTQPQSRRFKIPMISTLWERMEAAPRPIPEDSLLLRIFVQLLVTVGIIAMDVAAADVVDRLGVSFWAVPVSIVGAVWSWFHRRKRNVPVKFCIAIAMLAALGVFFGNLLMRDVDTRLALAELLIHLQVLHSFDLPRRRDLGYSIVIGLILIGVAGTVSQTLAFAPLLFLFLAIALPVLILDYRSRLGLTPTRWTKIGVDLAPKRLGLVLIVVLAIGLSIFAVMPRFPGYQLRTFPVSPPIELQGEFDPTTVMNSGYVGEGTEGTGSGLGTVEEGPGEMDDESYYGFNTRINQNLRGELEPKVVMRVRSQAEGFWRVLAFDKYTGQGWEVSRNEDEFGIETIDRPWWSYRFLISSMSPVGQTREVVQSYTIVADLPNLIPALYAPNEVYFPTQEIAIGPEGELRSPVPLSEGLTYSIVSEVPFRNRTLLGESSTDYTNRIQNYYFQIPPNISDRLRNLTESILAESPNPLENPYEISLYLAQYLKQNYTINPEMPFLSDDDDLVEAFLFDYEGGYPDHFSTVLTLMLRSVGVPSRLVVGFAPGEFNPFTGFYVVRNTDAYAMAEVYFPGHGWFPFDPIPGHELIPPSFEDYETFSVLKQFWEWLAGWIPSPVSGFFGRIFEWVMATLGRWFGWFTDLFTQGWVGVLIGLLLLTTLGFLGWLLWQGVAFLKYRRWLAKLSPIEALYQRMLKTLHEEGFPKPPAYTPFEYARHLHHHQPPERVNAIDEITKAYVLWRYGGRSPDMPTLQQLFAALQRKPSTR